MKKTLCKRCYGQGTILGGGMMQTECTECEGAGHLYDAETPAAPKDVKVCIDRRSKSYKEAIEKIKELNPEISDEDARDLFDLEYEKLG